MVSVKSAVRSCIALLFPTETRYARFDVLPARVLARTAVRTIVRSEPVCLAPLPYDNAIVRDAVHAMKYHKHERAALLLGVVLAPFVGEELADRRMLGSFLEPLVVPVPLHPTRLRERGFNQAERVATSLLAELDDGTLVLCTNALARTKHTAVQARSTDRAARFENMEGAFAVADPSLVAGRDIILLDDVITTGATLGAARAALLDAGARDVLCVAVAH